MIINIPIHDLKQPPVLKFPERCVNCAKPKETTLGIIAGFVIGVIVFFPIVFIAPDGTSSQTLGLPLVLGGFAGLIAGVLGGSAVEFFVKMLAVPFYGKLLARRPLTIIGFLAESDELIGISARFLRETKTVKLEFENEEIACEFKQINSLEI